MRNTDIEEIIEQINNIDLSIKNLKKSIKNIKHKKNKDEKDDNIKRPLNSYITLKITKILKKKILN